MKDLSHCHQEFLTLKKQFPKDLVLLRVGDFYETFDGDAVTLNRDAGTALTTRRHDDGARVSLAGVPHLNIEACVAKLVAKGHRVVVCNQRYGGLDVPVLHVPGSKRRGHGRAR